MQKKETRQITQEYIKEKFHDYYKKPTFNVNLPTLIENREFGFLQFDQKIMIRHKAFRNIEDLKSFIVYSTPSDVYYSSAYYSMPEAEMNKKGWIKADIVFDIDADHLELPCKKKHDNWICEYCQEKGSGQAPPRCPKCGELKVKSRIWICEVCLSEAKKEAVKLVSMLIDDFGIQSQNLKINFTGHRGYHIHVTDVKLAEINSEIRKEIVDYVSGVGFDIDSYLEEVIQELQKKAEIKHPTWSYKVTEEITHILFDYEINYLQSRGFSKKMLTFISEQRKKRNSQDFNPYKIFRGKNRSLRLKLVNYALLNCTVKVDTVVTTDIHRLIRLEGTLNGKTGLKAVEVKELSSFDPLKESIAITGPPVTVFIEESPQFRLGEVVYGPYEKESIQLPTEAALFLLCKERAILGND